MHINVLSAPRVFLVNTDETKCSAGMRTRIIQFLNDSVALSTTPQYVPTVAASHDGGVWTKLDVIICLYLYVLFCP
jgi:hypothetical protein